MKNFFTNLWTRKRARTEALLGVDGREAFTTEALGLDPTEAAKRGLPYREAMETLSARGRRLEIEKELSRLEALQTTIGTPHGYTLALVGLVLIEVWGTLTLLRSLDVGEGERPYLALGLALAIIACSKAAAEASSARPRAMRAAPNPAAPTGGGATSDEADDGAVNIPWRAIVVIVAYALLVAAMVTVRVVGHMAEAEGVTLLALAEGALTLALTAGPAWLAAHVATKRKPMVELAKRLALVRRRLRVAERQERSARRTVVSVEQGEVEHRDARARLEAAYRLEHERTRAMQREGLADTSELEGK